MANGTKNFELIRHTARTLFMYGVLTQTDLVRDWNESSVSAVNQKLKAIEAYLNSPNTYFSNATIPNRTRDRSGYRISFDEFRFPVSFLANLFDYASIDKNDLIFYFTFMQLFYENREDWRDLFNNINIMADIDFSDIIYPKDISLTVQRPKFLLTALFGDFSNSHEIIKDLPSSKNDGELYDNRTGIKHGDKINFLRSRALNIFALKYMHEAENEEFEKIEYRGEEFYDYSPHHNESDVNDKADEKTICGDFIRLLGEPDDDDKALQILLKLSGPFPMKTTALKTFFHNLIDQGLICENDRIFDTSKEYSFQPNIFSKLKKSQMDQLAIYSYFMYNCSELALLGHHFTNTITKYQIYKGWQKFDEVSHIWSDFPISYHNSSANKVLDNDIMYSLLQYRKKMVPICFNYRSNSGDKKHEILAFPLMLVCEMTYGRQYLCSYVYRASDRTYGYRMFRLDRITDVTEYNPDSEFNTWEFLSGSIQILRPVERSAKINTLYHELTRNSWNVSISNKTSPVHVYFTFDMANNAYKLSKRLLKTCRFGTLTKIFDCNYILDTQVNDVSEIIPWLRSFSPYVQVDPVSSPQLYKEMKKRIEEAKSQYESV